MITPWEDISEYFAIIENEVTDQFSNKDILLLCLRYVTYQNGIPIIHKTLIDSLHFKVLQTGQTIDKNILSSLH